MVLEIRQLYGMDLNNGFLDTLQVIRKSDKTDKVKTFQERLRRLVKTFVAVQTVADKTAVIGTATLLLEHKFYGTVAHVEDVAVHEDYQSQGVGTVLMTKLEEEARRLGCYKMILDCDESKVSFYEKLGFTAKRQTINMRKDLQ
jgi:glucosamine-phosphate N-acetyltransferase